jgi:L,D-transpeptidase YcbB
MPLPTIFRRYIHWWFASAASMALFAGIVQWPQLIAMKRGWAVRSAIQAQLNPPRADSLFPNDPPYRSMLLNDLKSFYNNRNFKPAWGKPQLDSLAAALYDADGFGLDPSAYSPDEIAAGIAVMPFADENAAAHFDLQATSAFMRYGIHLSSGSFDPSQLSDTVALPRTYPNLKNVLSRALEAGSIRASLEGLQPRSLGYIQLIRLLAAYRMREMAGGWPAVPTRRYLHHGDTGSAVAALGRRLFLGGFLDSITGENIRAFDTSLTQAVRRFQACHGLDTTGWADQATLEALNAPISWRIGQLRANLDRYRWVPDLDKGHTLLINLPEFQLYAMEDGRYRMTMKVIVGWRMAHTPVFSDSIVDVIFHPAWTIPRDVAREELLPRLQSRPSTVTADSFAIYDGWGDSARPIHFESIDWNKVNGAAMDRFKTIQLPGPTNPEGDIKFAMTNGMAIYLHASHETELFSWNNRGMSHGCIRVERPPALACYLLCGTGGWDSASIARALSDPPTRSISLYKRAHVLIVYLSAFIDTAGYPNFRPDIYGYDSLQTAITAVKAGRGLAYLLQ